MSRLRRPSVPRSAATLVALLGTTVTLAACGSTEDKQTATFTGEQGDVQAAVKKLSKYAADGDAGAICRELVSPELFAQFSKKYGRCSAGVKKALDTADYTALDVDQVTVDPASTSAVARIKTVEDTGFRSLTLTRSSKADHWRVTLLTTKVASTTPSATTPVKTTPAKTTPAKTTK